MKLTATGLLLFVAAGLRPRQVGARTRAPAPWAGYVAAAAEAGMVGALADWFAVTALFRHPLGIPIPHTAIIPTKKDQLGVSLGEFVGENFLSEDVVRQRLRAVGIGSRLGAWLAVPEHADRVTAELSTALRGALTVLRDSDVQAVVGEAITRRADAQEIAPGIGKMLEKIVADGGHKRVVDLVVNRAHDWLVLHGDEVMDAVQGGAPGWTPKFVDRKVGERVYKELLRFVTEMRDMPAHPARGALDRFLTDFASDLQSDTDTRARVERLKGEVLGRGEVQDLIASAWTAVRSMIVAAAEDERSELRLRVRASLLSLGSRMAAEPQGAGQGRQLGGGRGRVRRHHLPQGDHLPDHGHGGELGRRAHHEEDRGEHRPRPPVHPDQRHGGGLAGRSADLHGVARDRGIARRGLTLQGLTLQGLTSG